MVYRENANWPQHEHMVRWFKHWLLGDDNGVEKESTVRYYTMGAVGEDAAPGNVWRTAKDWPMPHTPTPLYLHANGVLSWKAPTDENAVTSYKSDPVKPMQIPGAAFPGAKDARAFENQAEVRTFTTAPLEKPIEWTGHVKAELFLSSTARDTDVIVRVCDIYPDGKSILIVDYPGRLRYREGFDKEVLMEPGKVYKVAFDVGWMSQIFNKGHRIRVTIASTGAPLYEPNPQTGDPLTIEFPKHAVAATNTIYHHRTNASRVIAPLPMDR
jgi:hypothetical protein